MSAHPRYRADDLLRYHQGLMSPAEMHALEKEAMEDPFLAEALEGYGQPGDHLTRLNELHHHFASNVAPFAAPSRFRRMYWALGMAAAVLLIVTAAYFAYRREATKPIATPVLARQQPENPPLSEPPAPPSTPVPTNPADTKATQAPAVASPEPNPLPTTDNSTSAIASTELPPTPVVADAEIQSRTDAAITTKSEDLQTSPSAPAAVAAAESKEESASSIETVAVSNVRVKKTNSANMKTVAAETLKYSSASAQPKQGWPAWQRYLKKNKNELRDENGQRILGTVIVRFAVDRNNRPDQIQVIQSSHPALEAEAIRLIQNGPSWVSASGAPAELTLTW